MLPIQRRSSPYSHWEEQAPQPELLGVDTMSAIYTQSDDTRLALLIATQLLARAAERGKMDDPGERAFIDMVDISILPAVRVAHHWSAVEPYAGPYRPLIRDTLVIIGQAIEMYTARA
jgi:hypothetical protein